VRLHAGFIPWPYADMAVKKGLYVTLKKAKERDYILPAETGMASKEHFNVFESMLTGRDFHDPSKKPDTGYWSIIAPKVIRDSSLAHQVNKLMDKNAYNDKFLVVCGIGHMAYGYGVPEGILSH
jgi:hypothetical protein